MYRLFAGILSASLLLVLASAGLAQPTPAPDPPPREVVFDEAERVGGVVEDPNVETVEVSQRGPHASLIRVRTDFRPQLLQSAELL